MIETACIAAEREPLSKPFGFKGRHVSELWQTAVLLQDDRENRGLGLGTQSVLWSDATVFSAHSEAEGNRLMVAVTEYAAKRVEGSSTRHPTALLDDIFPDVHDFARRITGREALRKTFTLNALVALDNAAWMLYANSRNTVTFDDIIPPEYASTLAYRHDHVGSIPVVTYGTRPEDIEALAGEHYFVFKIKLGHPGSQEEMLEKDKALLEMVHRVLGPRDTPCTADGRIRYYLDANGRYERKETVRLLLDHTEKIRMLDRVMLLEEPFPEDDEVDVSDLGVRVAADERAHTDEEAKKCIALGYGALALKPVAKTLSMTLKIARVAHEHGTPCFCADLTVNPILVDWNKNVAARLAPLPGIRVGLLETNGHQNYTRWREMEAYHPCAGATWTRPEKGVFHLDETFYATSGGILQLPPHYVRLVQSPEKP